MTQRDGYAIVRLPSRIHHSTKQIGFRGRFAIRTTRLFDGVKTLSQRCKGVVKRLDDVECTLPDLVRQSDKFAPLEAVADLSGVERPIRRCGFGTQSLDEDCPIGFILLPLQPCMYRSCIGRVASLVSTAYFSE